MKSSPHAGTKRARPSPDRELRLLDQVVLPPTNGLHESSPPPSSPSTSSFRNVSACNRCRLRKNRCDQNLPACSSCEKARVKCVGYDPITKREIPRAYVYYLESRVGYLESLLVENGISYAPSEDFDLGTKPVSDPSESSSIIDRLAPGHVRNLSRESTLDDQVASRRQGAWGPKQEEAEKLNKLVSNVGMVTVQGASDPRYLGSTSGISFARVVFAAVKSSVSSGSSERGSNRPNKPMPTGSAATSGTSMRDSCFGLQSRPAINQAPFPNKELGARLINLYFEHANPQIPILHRGEFMSLFDRAYSTEDKRRTPRELYMLNIVFAIGAAIILREPESSSPPSSQRSSSPVKKEPSSPQVKRQKLSTKEHQPEEYHASAIVHLESFLGSVTAADRPDGFGGGLEELQAVLLLAGFALLRPVAPGLWYIAGVAVRLAVDLGLHHEDGTGIDTPGEGVGTVRSQEIPMDGTQLVPQSQSGGIDAKERGRREWVRDLRRRLWWCAYSFDRLVSTCVGRPFGITDEVITTDFPSILDDNYITTSGFTAPSHAYNDPSYKRVAHHYFRLRLLQSEILQVLQHRQAQQAGDNVEKVMNEYMHMKLPSPFMQKFDSFRAWRKDIDRRLWEWKESAPRQKETTVQFSIQFLELNYWQAVIMLYRQSLSVPPVLANEASPSDEIASPMSMNTDEQEDDDDVFLKVAEAGQKTLKLYRQLHRIHLVNYTFLATHHLFMAGIAFLYAIWHSVNVRNQLTLDDVDFTVLAATSVLGDLTEKCPPAEACRDAFDRMSKATVQMVLSTTGFGSRAPSLRPPPSKFGNTISSNRNAPQQPYVVAQNDQGYFRPRRPPPQFDMNLRELFPEETQTNRDFTSSLGRWQSPLPSHSISMQPQPQPPSLQPIAQQPLPPLTPTYTQQPQTPTYSQPQTPSYTQSFDPPVINSNAYATNNGIGQYGNYDFPNDIDFLLADSTAAFNGHSGLNLGFDSEHDWQDGAQLDLFDGFFFGGTGQGGAMI